MAHLSPLAIYKALPKTNCGRCLLPTCLAFAAAVVTGQKKLTACPDLAPELIAGLVSQDRNSGSREMDQAEFLEKLQLKISTLDLGAVAHRIGAACRDNQLIINALGKEFAVDSRGAITSECHILPWVQAPLLSYLTNQTHGEITGQWISFRELKGGIDWQGLFTSRCEEPLKKLADGNPGLLGDIIDLFQGQAIAWYQADIALILHPLPKFPILICYQAPDDDLDSVLTIFFDACCGTNLHIKSIFTLCSGLVRMFAKIAERHQ